MGSVSPQNNKNKVILAYNLLSSLSLTSIRYLSSKENVETWILHGNPVIPGLRRSPFMFPSPFYTRGNPRLQYGIDHNH